MNKMKIILNGIIKENPVFVLMLGMCPTLGTTSSAINGMGMGLSTMFVLILSNIVISLIKNIVPDKVRIPCYIVVIATFVTILQLCMQAYVPGLYASLGLFIPLIVVIYPENFGSLIFVLAPGAFIVLGFLIAIINQLKTK